MITSLPFSAVVSGIFAAGVTLNELPIAIQRSDI
jgi:hypothetical protein